MKLPIASAYFYKCLDKAYTISLKIMFSLTGVMVTLGNIWVLYNISDYNSTGL